MSLASQLDEAARAEVQMVHEIYEGDGKYPVVIHIFSGGTREEVKGIFKAHMKTDKFMREMENSGSFGDIKGRTKTIWR